MGMVEIYKFKQISGGLGQGVIYIIIDAGGKYDKKKTS